MKTLKVVRALSLAFISIGAGYTPYAVGDSKLVEANVNISANIEAETCSAVTMGDNTTEFFLQLGSIPLKALREMTSSWYNTKSPGVDIEFNCPSGLYANVKITPISPICYVTSLRQVAYCGGPNKTIGIYARTRYKDFEKGGKETIFWSHDKVLKVAVDEKKKGSINIGEDTLLSPVMGVAIADLEPGIISADYTLSVWVD